MNKDKRKLLKALTLSGVTVSLLPKQWTQPVVNTVLLPVHAQTSCSNITYSQSSVWPSNGVTAATQATMTNGSYNECCATGTDSDSDGPWVMMDLGAEFDICGIVVGCDFNTVLGDGSWGPTYSQNHDVEYSTDGNTWTLATTTGTFSTGIKTIDVSITARYIRVIYGTSSDEVYVALTEFYAQCC